MSSCARVVTRTVLRHEAKALPRGAGRRNGRSGAASTRCLPIGALIASDMGGIACCSIDRDGASADGGGRILSQTQKRQTLLAAAEAARSRRTVRSGDLPGTPTSTVPDLPGWPPPTSDEEQVKKAAALLSKAPADTQAAKEIAGTYVGDSKQGVRHGEGKFMYANGEWYKGEWVDGKAHGEGVFTTKESVYSGSWHEDLKHGYGEETFSDGTVYVGNYRQGYRAGEGRLTWSNGNEYVGEFVNGNQDGFGTYKWVSGHQYTGQWSENYLHGKGRYDWPDGTYYEGMYSMNLKDGDGKFVTVEGELVKCSWSEGKPNGLVTFEGPTYDAVANIWMDGVMVSWANRSEAPTPR